MISYAIECHPARLARAERYFGHRLAGEGVTFACDPAPEGWSLPTGAAAWGQASDSDLHVVLQDDTTLSEKFLEDLPRMSAGISADVVLSLCAGWHSMTAAVARVRGACGRPYAPVIDSFVPSFGVCMATATARRAADFMESIAELGVRRSDDQVLRDFSRSRGIMNVACVLSLIQHDAEPLMSLVGGRGLRQSVAFVDDISKSLCPPPPDTEGIIADPLRMAPFVHSNGLTEAVLVRTDSGVWDSIGLAGFLHSNGGLASWLARLVPARAQLVHQSLGLKGDCGCAAVLVRHAILLGLVTAEDTDADWRGEVSRQLVFTAARNILQREHPDAAVSQALELLLDSIELGRTDGYVKSGPLAHLADYTAVRAR